MIIHCAKSSETYYIKLENDIIKALSSFFLPPSSVLPHVFKGGTHKNLPKTHTPQIVLGYLIINAYEKKR